MLDIKFIRDNKDVVEKAIRDKKAKPVDLDRLLALYDERKESRRKIEEANRKRKEAADSRDIEVGKRLKEELTVLEADAAKIDKEFIGLMIQVPNIPSPDTPVGEDESANKVLREWGEKPSFEFKPKGHWDLGRDLGVIDTESAGEIAGPRQTYLF